MMTAEEIANLQSLRRRLAELDAQVEQLNSARRNVTLEIERLEKSCSHDWEDLEPDRIRRESYMIPGDEPGTMGVDRQGPVYVPATTETFYRRRCARCGKEERTNRTTERKTTVPRW